MVIEEAYSEPSRTSMIELLEKINYGWKPLTIFAKNSILDVGLGSEHPIWIAHILIIKWEPRYIYTFVLIYSFVLTPLWRRPLLYRNQSIDLLCKSMDWFLHNRDLRHESVNRKLQWFNLLAYTESCINIPTYSNGNLEVAW